MLSIRKAPVLRAGAACLALAGAAAPAHAQADHQGVYIAVGTGAVVGSSLGSTMTAVNHPTRCDRLLYRPSTPYLADDPACSNHAPAELLGNMFDTGGGIAGGLALGYAAEAFRFEVEYFHRSHGSATRPAGVGGGAGNAVLSGKDVEWSRHQPPTETVRGYNAHQIFVNAYYDFHNDSPWTPYGGAGIGWAATNLYYASQFLRKPEQQYLQIAFDPRWPEAARRTAAGTLSHIDTAAGTNLFGFQLLAGADYALGGRAALGAALRWAWFEALQHDAAWSLIRSHAPVRADGVTPFDSRLTFRDISFRALTVHLKYRF